MKSWVMNIVRFRESVILKKPLIKCGIIPKSFSVNSSGKKHSKEFREKLRKAWIARRKRGVSLETRKKLSEAFSGKNHPLYGKRGKNSVNWGKKWSHSTKQKMSASAKLSWTDSRRKSAKGRKAWNKGKKHSQATKLKSNFAQRSGVT